MAGVREPAVLVMPADPAPLIARLGADRAQALSGLLHRRARDWARSVGTVGDPVAGEPTADAAARALDGAGGAPLLIAWPAIARWQPFHAAAALDDLAEGCSLAVGPIFDGGFYLIALLSLIPAVLESLDGPEALNRTIAAGHAEHIEVGLLRPERGLRTEADVAAALADPLLDAELRALLTPGGSGA